MHVRHLLASASLAASIAAVLHCGGANTSSTASQTPPSGGERLGTPETLTNQDAGAPEASAPTVTREAPVAPALGPIRVVAGTRAELPAGLRPSVRITSPRANATVLAGPLDVRLDVRDWPAPEGGRHVHLIVDNGPYIRIDHPEEPHRLADLTPGTHTLRAFPGWATHESIKREGAFAMVTFHVGRRSDENNPGPRQPLLTYSRPKGTYNGADADRILLDWYLTNVPSLSATGFRVRYTIDGSATGELVAWDPHYIENLPDGAHTIALDLLGANGQPVGGPFNHAEREIIVRRAGQADGGHGPGAHGAHGTQGAPSPGQGADAGASAR
jgi:hypothetical protein